MSVNITKVKKGFVIFSKGSGVIFLKFSLNILFVFLAIYIFLSLKVECFKKVLIEFGILFLFVMINRRLTRIFFEKIRLKIKPKFFILFSLNRSVKKVNKLFYVIEIFFIFFLSFIFLIFTLPLLFFYKNIMILKVVVFSSFVVSVTFVFSIFPYLYLSYWGENYSEE